MNNILTPPAYIECNECGSKLLTSTYVQTNNPFIPYGRAPICMGCLKKMIERNTKVNHELNWSYINKLCQWLDIPFIADKWIKAVEECGGSAPDAFAVYVKIFTQAEYGDEIDWLRFNKEYIELKKRGLLKNTIEVFSEEKRGILKKKWGEQYTDMDLSDLETLYEGIRNTQNITNPIQQNEAKKLCMISLEIDSLIRSGDAFDKQLTSYDKLKTSAGFTSANAKNNSDLDSVGEVFAYLEKKGWVNPYFQGANKDIVDASIANMQAYAQRLYVGESNMGEVITERLEILKNVANDDIIYDMKAPDLDENEKQMLNEILLSETEDEEEE